MNLSLQQVNNLITGIGLAAELPASAPELRRFIDIHGYELDDQGIPQQLSKFIHQDKKDTALFQIREYEIEASYIENHWDADKDACVSYTCISNLRGISEAEAELSRHLSDFSLLVPEWHCDNPL